MTADPILEGVDRDGRRWALLAVNGTIRARLLHGICTPAVMDAVDLVDVYGPLILSPPRPSRSPLPQRPRRAEFDDLDAAMASSAGTVRARTAP
ncbi:hypothetical protein [Nocardia pseudovaccinii]|uniref:hypothetical protein n=1 Tax=Nocardia pseudovaccinii TaxID=189540 RepID=UPI0007A3BB20|nr:hypothetical protein [Nocardia pseudovaccinii]